MKPLKIGLIDLVCKGPSNTLWAKIMHANLASIMPQVVATWCEQEGHEVTMVCYTGQEDLSKEILRKVDLVFISAFTQAALLAYSLSNYFRSQGAVTVLGGPHARCYPDDAVQYFDFASRRIQTIFEEDNGNLNPGLSISPDGRWILYSRYGGATGDIMLVDHFQ